MAENAPSLEEAQGRDLSPASVARFKAPKPTWFIKRMYGPRAGEIIAIEEKEAWDVLNNTSTWKFRGFSFIGHSDGTTFQKIINESMSKARVLEPQMAALKAEVDRLVAQEDRFMMNEVVDMEGDPSDKTNEENKQKVLRMRTIRERSQKKYEVLQTEYSSLTAGIVRRATEEETKVAIKNWKKAKVWPRDDVNIKTPHATPKERGKILKNMPS